MIAVVLSCSPQHREKPVVFRRIWIRFRRGKLEVAVHRTNAQAGQSSEKVDFLRGVLAHGNALFNSLKRWRRVVVIRERKRDSSVEYLSDRVEHVTRLPILDEKHELLVCVNVDVCANVGIEPDVEGLTM